MKIPKMICDYGQTLIENRNLTDKGNRGCLTVCYKE